MLYKHIEILQSQINQIPTVDKGTQILLALKYRELLHSNFSLPTFEDVEFRAFSQNGEDGILLYIFSVIGSTDKKLVEMCAGDGIECNAANLIINHGWTALLFDGKEYHVAKGKAFYAKNRDTLNWPPRVIHAWIAAENVNELILENGFQGEIDLLSLDMDGVDYWIWKALTIIQPRVVVLEYMNIWNVDRSVTVPYKPDFDRFDTHPDYCGASLSAFVKLGREKGYRLVGCNRYAFNAFFVRSDVGEDALPEVLPNQCLQHPMAKCGNKTRLPEVINFEWIEV